MEHGKVMLEAIRRSFPAIDFLLTVDEDSYWVLHDMCEGLSVDAVKRMTNGLTVSLDQDFIVRCPGGREIVILGPYSEMNNGARGVMKITSSYWTPAIKTDDEAMIVCEAKLKRGQKTPVLYTVHFDRIEKKGTYVMTSIELDENGNANVIKEISDQSQLASLTSGDYKNSSNNYENE